MKDITITITEHGVTVSFLADYEQQETMTVKQVVPAMKEALVKYGLHADRFTIVDWEDYDHIEAIFFIIPQKYKEDVLITEKLSIIPNDMLIKDFLSYDYRNS